MKTIQNAQLIHYIWLILLSAIWGSAFVGIEYALVGFPPFIIAFGRIFLASLFLLGIVFYKGIALPKDKQTWMILVLIGFLNNAMPFYLIPWGQQYISASSASVMLAIGPFIALVMSHFITHDEKFTIYKLIGVVFGFAGVFLLLGDDFLQGNSDSLYGKFALLLAVFGYISSGFLIRKISHVNIVVCSACMFTTASIMMSPFLIFIPMANLEFVSFEFLVIVYLALIPTAGASLLRINLVQKVGVQFMSQVAYLIPIFAIFWSWLFFDEIPKITLLIALVFIFLGLIIRRIK